MVEIGADGLDPDAFSFPDLKTAIETPSPKRIFAVARGLAEGMSINAISRLSAIDAFFVGEISRMIEAGQNLAGFRRGRTLSVEVARGVRKAKCAAYSDRSIAKSLGCTEAKVRELRSLYGITPGLAQIDTLAAKYPAETNYLYLTYGAEKDDVPPSSRKKFLDHTGCCHMSSPLGVRSIIISGVGKPQGCGYNCTALSTSRCASQPGERLVPAS